jgi:hypothetical protein
LKFDVPANPVDVGIFGTAAVVSDTENFDHAVVEPGCGVVGKQAQRRAALLGG